jgi:hypothetical protein
MRGLTITTTLILLGAYGWAQGASERTERAQARADLQAALEIRCDTELDATASECQRKLEARFASGTINPEAILRTHCMKWRGPFVGTREEPPQLCVDRFGGWLSS